MKNENSIEKYVPLKAVWIILQVLWYLSWVAAALVALVIIVAGMTGFNVKYARLPVEVSFIEEGEDSPFMRSQDGAVLPVVGFKDVQMHTENYEGINRSLAIPAFLIAGMLWIFFQIKVVLRTVRKGKPFDPDNSRRIRWIGIMIALAGPVVGGLNYIYALDLVKHIDIEGAIVKTDLEIYPFVIVLGLLILVIGQIFSVGSKLQLETDLTV